MKEVLHEFKKDQIDFICKECNVTMEQLYEMDEDALYDVVYEKMCDIEVEEVCNSSGESESDRCEMASDIVTLLGNTLL